MQRKNKISCPPRLAFLDKIVNAAPRSLEEQRWRHHSSLGTLPSERARSMLMSTATLCTSRKQHACTTEQDVTRKQTRGKYRARFKQKQNVTFVFSYFFCERKITTYTACRVCSLYRCVTSGGIVTRRWGAASSPRLVPPESHTRLRLSGLPSVQEPPGSMSRSA